MPARGLIVVLFFILATVAGYYFLVAQGGNESRQGLVSRDITDDYGTEVSQSHAALPTFDIVRVDRTGQAIVAGRAVPGAEVTVLSNGNAIGSALAGPDGTWVVVVEAPLETGSQEITLSARTPGAEPLSSVQNVVVDVSERRDSMPLVILAEPGGASRILQRPDAMAEPGRLSVEIIDYDQDGGLVISGRAAPQSRVRLYIDNAPLGDAVAKADGVWMLAPKDVAPGTYILRVDELDSKAQVTARIEVPFERADPEIAAQSLLRGRGSIVVQPGNSLWRIARQIYGEGVQYTVIYQANRDQIRDPDLIYPGQVFEIPEDPVDE